MKVKDVQFQEAQRIPNKLGSKRPTPRHILIKMARLKDNNRFLRARKKQLVTYKGALRRLSFDFSIEIFQGRMQWHEIFKVMKSKDLQPRLLTQQDYHLKLKEK